MWVQGARWALPAAMPRVDVEGSGYGGIRLA